MVMEMLVGGGIAAVAAIGLGTIGYRRVSSVMPFLFANARIQARSGKSISQNQFEAIADKRSLSELASALSETDYAGAFEKAGSAKDFHSALEKSLIEKAKELREMSPEKFQNVLHAYMRFYEAKILKAFYRSRFFEGHAEEIDNALLFAVGEVDSSMLQRLGETRTLADINTVMASTSYGEVFGGGYGSLEEFEVGLDSFIFGEFVELLKKLKIHDKRAIFELVNMKFDIINLLVLIKCIVRKVPKEERERLLVKNSSVLRERFGSLVEADNTNDLIEACKGTVYSQVLEEAADLHSKDGSLSHFETGLYRKFKKVIVDSELYHVQGPYPLFSYLLKKELEARNLMVASKGIESHFSKEEIRELMA